MALQAFAVSRLAPSHTAASSLGVAGHPTGRPLRSSGLMRLDRGTSRLRCGSTRPVASTRLRRDDPATASRLRQAEGDWTGVRVTGSVINHQLIADEIEPAYVPMTAHWRGSSSQTSGRPSPGVGSTQSDCCGRRRSPCAFARDVRWVTARTTSSRQNKKKQATRRPP